MAMVEEQGSTAMVCGKVNFGAFRGKVSIALQRGRVFIAMRCGGGVDTAVICRIAVSPCCGQGETFAVRGEKGGASEVESVNIAAPYGEVNLASGFAAMSTIRLHSFGKVNISVGAAQFTSKGELLPAGQLDFCLS